MDNLDEESARVSISQIESIGETLFEELFPEQLRVEYWKRIKKLREQGIVKTLLITSDEPWIPWEMVKPYEFGEDGEDDQSDGFLAETFQTCRWLAGRGPFDGVRVQAATVVVPKLDLPFARREQEYFVNTLGPARQTLVTTLQRRADLLDAFADGGFQLLHFAAHGRFDGADPDASPLTLQDGELTPDQMSGSSIRGLRTQKPIVFSTPAYGASCLCAHRSGRLGGQTGQ
ncbi:MAG: hypothetical protein HC802_04205 [Caldilineaceae bacterium]|nr:hypothetical protein [Caldilineaceae bacterium]